MIIVFLIYVNVSEIVWRNIVSDCIKLHITFPPADFTAVMSLWHLLSLSCVVFIFIPSFYHISSSSPNVDLCPFQSISLWFVSDLFPYGLSGEVKWRHGSFMDINGSSLLMPYRAAVSYGIWNTHTVDSPSTLIFFPCPNECKCCTFLPLINVLLLYYSRYNLCHNFNQLLTLSLWFKKVIEW